MRRKYSRTVKENSEFEISTIYVPCLSAALIEDFQPIMVFRRMLLDQSETCVQLYHKSIMLHDIEEESGHEQLSYLQGTQYPSSRRDVQQSNVPRHTIVACYSQLQTFSSTHVFRTTKANDRDSPVLLLSRHCALHQLRHLLDHLPQSREIPTSPSGSLWPLTLHSAGAPYPRTGASIRGSVRWLRHLFKIQHKNEYIICEWSKSFF